MRKEKVPEPSASQILAAQTGHAANLVFWDSLELRCPMGAGWAEEQAQTTTAPSPHPSRDRAMKIKACLPVRFNPITSARRGGTSLFLHRTRDV